jgi:hypothetical protein
MQQSTPGGPARPEWDAAVGRLLGAAAEAEARLADLLRVLAGTEGSVAARLLPQEVPEMAGLVRDLLPVAVPERRLVEDFLRWVHAVARLCALRATVVHSIWEVRHDGRRTHMHPSWSRTREERHPMTAGELTRTTAALSRFLGAPADERLLRLDKAAPELSVFPWV